jgi:TfoX N-terminal domain
MPYSESLADRIRQALGRGKGIEEKKMFGGVGCLLGGNMLVGMWQTSLIARIGPDQYDAALKMPNLQEFDITGRPMKGWVLIEPDGIDSDGQLGEWIRRATSFVETLPAK